MENSSQLTAAVTCHPLFCCSVGTRRSALFSASPIGTSTSEGVVAAAGREREMWAKREGLMPRLDTDREKGSDLSCGTRSTCK